MNISWLSHYFSPEIGAPSARINDLSRCWIEDGHTVCVNTCFPNHPAGELYPGYQPEKYMFEMRDGIHVYRYWTYITPNRGFIKKTLGHVSFLPSSVYLNRKPLLEQQPDIVIGTSPTPFAALAAAKAAKRMKIPFIMEIRDLWPDIFIELGVLKNPILIRILEVFINSLYRKADGIVTVTESFRKTMLSRGFTPAKVVNIPNGADTDFWDTRKAGDSSKLKHTLGLDGKFIVLYIGAHGISHSLAKIIDTAAMLKDRPGIHFLFVGDGAEKPMLMEKAKKENLSSITFLNPTDKNGVREYYALADVCLVPLRNIPLFETFIPSKMFEMMSMRRPILASVAGESAEILKTSESAVIVPPENSRQIRDELVALTGKPEKRNRMGKNGRAFVSRDYSRSALSKRYINFIRQIDAAYRS